MSRPTPERRYRRDAELRAIGEDGKPDRLQGFAVVYNSPSEDLGGFVEIILPGALTEALKSSDVRALIDHNPSLILARSSAGTLALDDRAEGLWCDFPLPAVSYAADLGENLRNGNVSGMSFGFIVAPDGERWEEKDGRVTRTISKIAEIFDVSAVTFPAYSDTSIALRSLDAFRSSHATPPPAAADPDEFRRLRLAINESTLRP